MTFLSQPAARLRALIEGTYPVVPVTGRSVPAGTLTRAKYRGPIGDTTFAGGDQHASYTLTLVESGDVDADPPNSHAGSQRRFVVYEVTLTYLVQPDGRITRSTACASEEDAADLGHETMEAIGQALRYPLFWAGTSPAIASVRQLGPAVTTTIPRQRVQVSARWRVLLSYAPGTDWST
ncbi:MAG TPA: hypothetical protein VFV33_01265 [Gemmatimonadaceae bacterium]|nr:hypothetical protein [Gemmatimonadaceae bacterium]